MHLREQEKKGDKRRWDLSSLFNRRRRTSHNKNVERRPVEHEVDPQTGRRTRKQSRFQTVVSSLLPDVYPQRTRRNRPNAWLHAQFTAWWHPNKFYSLGALLVVAALFTWLSYGDRWFIYAEDVHFHGLTYLESDELYDFSSLSGLSAFWTDPAKIRADLLAHSYVADSIVNVQLPTQVDIQIQEIRPIALWIAAEQEKYWLLEDGTALIVRGPIDRDLMQIIDLKLDGKDVERLNEQAIDLNVLNSALALVQHLPKLPNLRYNKLHGLHFNLPDDNITEDSIDEDALVDENTTGNKIAINKRIGVIWGDGYNLETKLLNLQAARKLIAEGQVNPDTVDLRPLTRPYFR